MELIAIFIILLYVLSTTSYFAYLFLQKNLLHRTGYYFLLAGFITHCITFTCLYLKTGHLPVHNLHETLSIAAWTVAGIYLLFRHNFHLKILGIFASALTTILTVTAYMLPIAPAETSSLFNSFWVVLHVTVIFAGEASFALAFGAGLIYLFQEHAIKSKKHGFFFRRLPSLELMDSTGYACLVAGFTLLTIGLILGSTYAKIVGGKFWNQTPKEVWSGITWIIYAVLLHQRLTVGWRGKRAALMAIFGFIILIFTFVGVNCLFEGHHGLIIRLQQ